MSIIVRKVFATVVATLILKRGEGCFLLLLFVDVISNCRFVLYPFLGLLCIEGMLH